MNNETLEIFTSDNYVFIKNDNSNNSMLIIDLESGIVRDIFNFHGLLGTMPCYHDNKTDNAISYAEKLLDYLSDEFKELQMIFAIGGVSTVLFDGLEIVGFGVADFSLGSLLIIGLPIAILVAPDQVNDAWKKLMYLLNPNYKDYPDIPIYDNNDPNNPIINSGNIIDENSNDNFKIIPNKKSIKTYNKVNFYRRDSEIKIGPVPDGKDSNDTDWDYNLKVGKYIRELYDGYKKAKQLGKGTEFALSHLKELLIISLYFETIDLVDFVLKLTLFEFVKESLTKK